MKWAAAVVVSGVLVVLCLSGLQPPVRAQAEPQSVMLRAREFAFNPREITVRTGEITIVVTNEGGIEHALIVQDDSRTTLVEIPSILPEKSEQVRVTLSPGSYTFFCPIGSGFHRRMGMVGVLKVTE